MPKYTTDNDVMRYQVQKTEGVGGRPIPEDEPCIVIRAQDVFAPVIMEIYMTLYRDVEDHDSSVLDECERHLRILRDWQSKNFDLVKLADR